MISLLLACYLFLCVLKDRDFSCIVILISLVPTEETCITACKVQLFYSGKGTKGIESLFAIASV